MKKLSQFVKFDFEGFSKGKLYKVTGVEKWDDYDTKVHLGTRLKTVIAKDETPYKQKDGEMVTNLYEQLTFKVPKDIKIPIGSYVVPVNPVAVVYGNYRNQLSVKADDIRILQQNQR